MTTINESLADLGPIIEKNEPSRIAIVTSASLLSLLSTMINEVQRLSEKYAPVHIMTIPDGEKAKEWNVLEKTLHDFMSIGLDRKSLIIAIGGGTVGDMIGFASGIYQRGIPYINIPTTLVAQADSSIGGKTGVNFGGHKNQIGMYHTPLATIIDPRCIMTLSEAQIIDGLGEIIKCGFVKDVSIIEALEGKTLAQVKKGDILSIVARKALLVKKYCVTKDPYDAGIRNYLNVGHTVGHAVELAYGLSHGEAVLVGMRKELEIGERMGITQVGTLAKFERLLETLGITHLQKNYTFDLESIKKDKKVSGKEILFPFVVRAGECVLKKMAIVDIFQ